MRRDALLVAGSVAVFGLLTAALAAGGALIDLDLAVHRWADQHRPPAADTVARVLNRLGQGGVLLGICAVLAGLLGLVRWWRGAGWWRAGRPMLYVLVAAATIYLSVAGVKRATERGAPSSELPAEQTVPLFGSLPAGEYATGYPSGHAVNVVVWYGMLVLLASALLAAYRPGGGVPPALGWAIRLVPPVVVVAAQTYLSFHWLTDSLAGLALGLAIDRGLSLLRRLA